MADPLIGAHMSIAGGVHRAPARGAEVGCAALQVFTGNPRQWRTPPVGRDEADAFRANCVEAGIALSATVAHVCYLLNLASPDRNLRRRSERAFAGELERAEAFGIPWVVTHPGAHTGSGEARGIGNIGRAVGRLLRDTRGFRAGILLENTAGAGTVLGGPFEHLDAIMAEVADRGRLGVCLDTCHAFAAGHDLRTREAYGRTMAEFDDAVGLDHIHAFHFNDCLGGLGEGRDRHAHIGRGKIGEDAFGFLMRDRRFRGIPKLLETPKGTLRGRPWDVINLTLLRELAQRQWKSKVQGRRSNARTPRAFDCG